MLTVALLIGVIGAASAGTSAVADSASDAGAAAGDVRVEAAAEPRADLAAEAAQRVAAMSVRERAASVVMGHIPTQDPAEAEAYVEGLGLGGFILMGANVGPDERAVRSLTRALAGDPDFPTLIAIDEEGGDVTRLPWDAYPSARTLKDVPGVETRDAFAARAALVDRAGANVNFGIVADVTADPGMFIFRRALGTDPASAAERVSAAVAGEGDTVLSTLKHFPGHGAAPGDSHAGIPATDMALDDWLAADAAPFRAGIETGAALLMFGHLRYTAVDADPASLSAEWHRIAREQLGFDGVAVTDDLGMLQASGEEAYADPVDNAVAALAAGNDLVLGIMFSTPDTAGRIVDGIVSAVESGDLPAARLEEAATRVAQLRLERAASGAGFLPCADCTAAG
jgi:beta-N-acetylhexosaminidase